MGYVNSRKYGSAIQLYKKASGDTSYYITYKDETNKLKRIKIGDKSKGINEAYCNQKRIEIINSINLGEEPPSLARKKKKKVITLDEVGELYFKQREAHVIGDIKTLTKTILNDSKRNLEKRILTLSLVTKSLTFKLNSKIRSSHRLP